MKLFRGYVPLAIILGMLLLAGILFEPFVVNKILVPITAAFWLLVRIFILSVDQMYCWVILTGLGFMLVVFRAIHHLIYRSEPVKMDNSPDARVALMSAEVWRNSIELAAGGSAEQASLKRELARVLVSIYTFRQSGSAFLEVYEPLRLGKIPLPEKVRGFIFAQEPPGRKPNLLQSIWRAIQTQIQKWSGRETSEYYLAIDEVLSFMEKSLEMTDDNH